MLDNSQSTDCFGPQTVGARQQIRGDGFVVAGHGQAGCREIARDGHGRAEKVETLDDPALHGEERLAPGHAPGREVQVRGHGAGDGRGGRSSDLVREGARARDLRAERGCAQETRLA